MKLLLHVLLFVSPMATLSAGFNPEIVNQVLPQPMNQTHSQLQREISLHPSSLSREGVYFDTNALLPPVSCVNMHYGQPMAFYNNGYPMHQQPLTTQPVVHYYQPKPWLNQPLYYQNNVSHYYYDYYASAPTSHIVHVPTHGQHNNFSHYRIPFPRPTPTIQEPQSQPINHNSYPSHQNRPELHVNSEVNLNLQKREPKQKPRSKGPNQALQKERASYSFCIPKYDDTIRNKVATNDEYVIFKHLLEFPNKHIEPKKLYPMVPSSIKDIDPFEDDASSENERNNFTCSECGRNNFRKACNLATHLKFRHNKAYERKYNHNKSRKRHLSDQHSTSSKKRRLS